MFNFIQRISSTVVTLAAGAVLGMYSYAGGSQAIAPEVANSTLAIPQTQTIRTQSQKHHKKLKLQVTVAGPDDIKVKEGDLVTAGQIIAVRDMERRPLLAQQKEVNISLQKIQGLPDLVPPRPRVVPKMPDLPPANYEQEIAEANSANTKLARAERVYSVKEKTAKSISIETSQVSGASEKYKKVSHDVNMQVAKINDLKKETDLPPEIVEHEEQVLFQKQSEMDDARSLLEQHLAQKQSENADKNEKLNKLQEDIALAQDAIKLAKAKYDAAVNHRQFLEYEHILNLARRTEEENVAEQAYTKQMQEYVTQKRDREFQLAQLNQKLTEVDGKLSQLTTVKAPYAGTIRRIKNMGQVNNLFTVRITIDVDPSALAPSVSSPKPVTQSNKKVSNSTTSGNNTNGASNTITRSSTTWRNVYAISSI